MARLLAGHVARLSKIPSDDREGWGSGLVFSTHGAVYKTNPFPRSSRSKSKNHAAVTFARGRLLSVLKRHKYMRYRQFGLQLLFRDRPQSGLLHRVLP
jgi:hypothetical protein